MLNGCCSVSILHSMPFPEQVPHTLNTIVRVNCNHGRLISDKHRLNGRFEDCSAFLETSRDHAQHYVNTVRRPSSANRFRTDFMSFMGRLRCYLLDCSLCCSPSCSSGCFPVTCQLLASDGRLACCLWIVALSVNSAIKRHCLISFLN